MKDAWTIYGKWATDPKYTVGGAKGTLSTAFLDAIYNVFSDPPKAMMVRQSGFAGGAIRPSIPNLKYGTDYDFFLVPGAQGMQAGADWMMAFSDKPAVKALVAYLSSDAGGAKWAKVGFDLTPNQGRRQLHRPDQPEEGPASQRGQGLHARHRRQHPRRLRQGRVEGHRQLRQRRQSRPAA